MGGFHGAKIGDLVGLKQKEIIPNLGLFSDDGLAVSSTTNRQIENMKKKICNTFKYISLFVMIETNLKYS